MGLRAEVQHALTGSRLGLEVGIAAATLLLTYNPTYTKSPEPPSRVWVWSAVLAKPLPQSLATPIAEKSPNSKYPKQKFRV